MKRPLETIAAFATGGGENSHSILGNEQDDVSGLLLYCKKIHY